MTGISCSVSVEKIGDKPVSETVSASEDECADLAERFGFLAVRELEAETVVRRMPGKGFYRLSGTVRATIEQACSVTLEPVIEAIDEAFEEIYSDALPEAGTDDKAEIDLDADMGDAEPVENGRIDIGEAVVQQLALMANPWPRSEAAIAAMDMPIESIDDASSVDESPRRENPFAALAEIRDKDKKSG